ncbi:MAG: hypothetical protein IIB87_00695 [Chloroflexi bacterium]|nr:hypothetical protein [Chloroflexota bacterium]
MKRILAFSLLLVLAAIWANLSTTGINAAAIKPLPGCGTNTLSANDDGSTSIVPLPFTINFFGASYSSLFVNNNGNVTFGASLSSFTPFDLTSTSSVIIAPFFGDVDTRGAGSGAVTYGNTTFGGRSAFCVNWVNVGYFNSNTDKLNSFQLLLVDRSDIGIGDFDIIFNYDQIQWETGNASGGTGGLGGSSARVGYSNGVDTSLELPGSAVNGAFLDSSTGGLVHNSRSSLESGRYIFPVRGGTAPTGGFVVGRVFGDTPDGLQATLAGATVQICRQDVVPAVCSTTTTDANGDYSVAGLAPGAYNGMAVPPSGRPDLFPDINDLFDLGSNQGLFGYDFKLELPRPLPPGVNIDSIATTSTGAPVLSWSAPVQVTTMNETCLGGSASYELILAGTVIASGPMPQTATPGLFKGTIPPLRPQHGSALLRIQVSCPGAGVDKTLEVDVYIDPSGYVRDVNGNGIVGATVTLLRSDSSSGPFDVVPDGSAVMSPSNRTNPDTTDAEGRFGWDVIAGFYIVRAEAAGCVSPDNPAQSFVETEVMTIPPPVTDLDLRLDCGEEPAPTPTPVLPTGLSGDVNCNGSVNSIDAALVLQFIAGLTPSLGCQADADVNENGDVNSIDAAIILQFVAGLIPGLPV